MISITIHEQACRGCQMCVDVCPTKVLSFDDDKRLCVVQTPQDCIACLTCSYLCPSGAISHADYHTVKNFYRDLAFGSRMSRFL